MQVTLDGIFGSPDLHLFALDGEHGQFLRMDREAYRRSIFLDARISPADAQMLRIPIAPLLQHNAKMAAAPRTGWIFHVAQCGSTLLARALDGDANLVLREPMPLRQLAVSAMPGSPGWQAQVRLAATMAARRYRGNLPSIVKATVPVNFILPSLAAADPGAPAIFLYFAFEPYLLAILRSPNHRQWVQRVTSELGEKLGVAAAELAGLADAELAALLWRGQIGAFHAAMAHMPGSRSLDAEMLFNAPRESVAAAAALFDRPMAAAELDAILAGPLFATYSKNPSVAFDNVARKARQAEQAIALAPEIAGARNWLAQRFAGHLFPGALDRPLSGERTQLL